MVRMGLEEVGTEGVKKKDKKSKDKSKNDISIAVDLGGNHSDEAHMTKDGIIDVCNNSVKTISRKGDKESKKTEKRKVKDGSRTEESNYHFGERDANECGKESEIHMQNNHVGSLIKVIRGKKKKKRENSGVSDDKLQCNLDIGINMTPKGPDVLQNGIDDSAAGQGSDSIVVMSPHKKTNRKSKKSDGNFGFGAGNKDITLLTKQEIFEKSNQQGERVEPFGEGHTFESVEKEEKNKRKRKKDKCIKQEIFEKSNQHGESVKAFSEGHALECFEKEEKRKQKRKKDESIVSEGDLQGRDLLDPKGKRPSTLNERDNELLTETTIDTTA